MKNLLKILGGIFDKENIENKLRDLEQISSRENFWKDKNLVKKTVKQKKIFEEIITSFRKSLKDFDNLKDLYSLAHQEKDEETLKDCYERIEQILQNIKKNEINCFLSGENDDYDIYLEIHAGAGGTESQDWADMLRRMYIKWFDKKKFKYQIISEHKGEEAGIKSSTVQVSGDYLYGLMKSESGVHRLVRISPFDSGARRHTSFASVWVYPAVEDDINIKVDEKKPILVCIMEKKKLDKYYEILKILRDNDINSEIYLDSKKKFSKQLEYASKKDLKLAIICGENEFKANTITLKNLQGVKGENQITIPRENLINEVKKYI